MQLLIPWCVPTSSAMPVTFSAARDAAVAAGDADADDAGVGADAGAADDDVAGGHGGGGGGGGAAAAGGASRSSHAPRRLAGCECAAPPSAAPPL
ncbi:unnamed protein product [Closterium sp. NIES-53]